LGEGQSDFGGVNKGLLAFAALHTTKTAGHGSKEIIAVHSPNLVRVAIPLT